MVVVPSRSLVFHCAAVLFLHALLAVTVRSDSPSVDDWNSVRPIAFVGVSVIPMNQSGIKHDQTVIVRKGTIVSLGPALRTAVPKNAQRIEAADAYLIPGLVDSHVHLQQSANANRAFLDLFLAKGVITILNLYGTPTHLSLRENVRLGRILGPRIFTGGPH